MQAVINDMYSYGDLVTVVSRFCIFVRLTLYNSGAMLL